jgi:hypothetical protein
MTDITLEQRAKAVVFDMLMREGYGDEIARALVDNPDRLHLSGKDAFALVEAALRLPAGADWRPIETAPKDGLVDIWIDDKHGGTRRCDCHYDSICREWRTIRPDGRLLAVHERHVTHWMPRPAAPRHEPGEVES